MIIFISMFVVLTFFYLLHLLNQQGHYLKNNNKPNKFFAFAVFAYIIFWAGMRSGFVDTLTYIQQFNSISWSDLSTLDFSFNSGWGFKLIEILFKRFISSHYQSWLMFIAIISGVCVATIFYKYSENYFYSVFLFLAAADFTWMMNGIRQFLAVSILFTATSLIEKNKWIKYLLLVLLCSTIHGTALMMIPIFFFARSKPWKLNILLLLTCVLFALAFTSAFTELLENIFKETRYHNIGEQFLEDDGSNPLRMLVYTVTPLLAFFAKKQIPQDDIKINIFVNMSILTCGLYLISMVTSGILLGRLPIYTQLYQYILLPYVINELFEKHTKTFVYIASIALFLLYFYFSSENLYYKSEITGLL